MRRYRISIAELLSLVALAGLSIASLIHPSPLAGNAFYSLALATLLVAVLAAVYRKGASRAFRVGFSTCGWAYFLAWAGPEPLSHFGQNLVTTTLIDVVYPVTAPKTAVPGAAGLSSVSRPAKGARMNWTRPMIFMAGGFGGGKVGPPAPPPTPWQIVTTPDRVIPFGGVGSPMNFRKIGHSQFCLAFAAIGGLATRHFRATRDRDEAGPG